MEVVDTPRSSRRDTDLSPHSAHPVTPSGASLAPAFARSALPRERVRSLTRTGHAARPHRELDRCSEFPAFAMDRSEPQQRDVTHRLMITRLRSGAISMAIISRRSASLMAARTFALPTLARSAIRATGRVHFPVAAASFRMTASTAIASVFRSSLIEGGTTTVAARNRRPHATRWAVSDLLRFSTIRVSITTSLRRSGPSEESTCPISITAGARLK